MWILALLVMLALIATSVSLLLTANAASVAQAYRRIATLQGPDIPARAGRWAFDISWVDQGSQLYFVADAGNARVDIFDARSSTYLGSIGGFTGFHGNLDTQGPAGLLTDNLYQLWAGDGNSTVKVIDLFSRRIIATLSTGGKMRADELAYDPQEQLLLVTNGSDKPPFATFISATSRRIVGKIVFPDATDGLEAPTWDAVTHKFYLSVPATRQSPGGAVAVVDPLTRKVIQTYPLSNCHPSGIATGPGLDLLLGCDGHPQILNRLTGHVVATITQVNGCDEVWYNPGDQRYYLAAFANASGPVLAVVDAQSYHWLASIPTVPKAHSVAVDAQNNHIFMPLSGQGIAVYALTA